MKELQVFDSTGLKQGAMPLGIEFSEAEMSPRTYACAIRVLLQNWRQGTVSCKSRGELSFSNKKPWRQKGTGRARVSSLRSPLWRKGGVIFGPQPRVRTLKLNRKQMALSLKNVLQAMLQKSNVYCFDLDFEGVKTPKTKQAFSALKKAGLHEKKGVLFLPYQDTANFAAFRNIPNVGILSFDQPNVFDLSSTEYWMILKRDLPLFKEMVAKWN